MYFGDENTWTGMFKTGKGQEALDYKGETDNQHWMEVIFPALQGEDWSFKAGTKIWKARESFVMSVRLQS